MDIVTLGAALNGSAEYVNSHFVGGSNIQIVDNPDGTQTINASGEVSSEDTVARAEIAEMKDGTNIDSFGDVETALAAKANSADVSALPDTTKYAAALSLTINSSTYVMTGQLKDQNGDIYNLVGIRIYSCIINLYALYFVDFCTLGNTSKFCLFGCGIVIR